MSNVELRQLQYFVAVAEHLHFGKAAEALSIGQPAVSQQVARLERILGTDLLDRTPRTVRLTESGDRFLPEARKVLVALDHARESIAAPDGQTRKLRIGTCSGMGQRLDAFLAALDEALPQVAVELTTANTQSRLERVQAGQLDAAFVRGTHAARGVEILDVWTERLMAAVPANHPFARRVQISLADLTALPLRIVTRRTNPTLVDLVLRRCAESGSQPRRFEFDGGPIETLLAAVATGAPSWTVVYESHARMLHTSRVAFVPIESELEVTTSIAVPARLTSREAAPLLHACRVAAGDTR
jgi:DNA-binding transcriptional LysR family regulator